MVKRIENRIVLLEEAGMPVAEHSDAAVDLGFFIEGGKEWRFQLLELIHGERDARDIERTDLDDWYKTSRGLERDTQLGDGASMASRINDWASR